MVTMIHRWTVLTVSILLCLATSAAGADDRSDKIARYKKHMNDSSADVRITTVPILEGVDDAEAAVLLIEALKDREYRVRDASLRVLGGYRSESAVAALEAALAAVPTGKARSFVAMALGRIGKSTSLAPLVAAGASSDWETRRAVAEALGSFKDAAGREALGQLSKDSEPVVRTVAADSLGKVGDASSVETVNALLADPTWQVKAAACGAAGQLRDKRSVLPLIALLKEEGRIKVDAKIALTRITNFNFGVDVKEWEDWWDRSGATFEVSAPPASNPKAASGASKGADRRYAGPGPRYYGIATPSKNIIFMLDVSRSMAEEIDKPPSLGDGTTFASDVKMEIAKEELIRTIRQFKENVRFSIILFESEVTVWKKDAVPATDSNKADAIAFISKQQPRGLEVAHNNRAVSRTQAGRTNIWDALQRAFGVAGIGTYDKGYNTSYDTIFLLSDGEPTAGKITREDEICEEVKRLNGLRRIVLHTINLGKTQGGFLKKLADENGGQYVDLAGDAVAPGK